VNPIRCKFPLISDLRRFFGCLTGAPFTVISITCEVLTCKDFWGQGCNGMPARKMRVEIFNGSGDRYTITFEGQVTREKVLRLLDLVELLGGIPMGNPGLNRATSELSKIDKIRLVVEKSFPIGWFSSRDIQSTYEEEFKEPVSLSTVSTYLSRMAGRGVLTKNRASNRRRYRIMTEVSRVSSFTKDNK